MCWATPSGNHLVNVASGHNQTLKKEKPEWESDYHMTRGQRCGERDGFGDTALAFEGRKGSWDASKAAAHASESNGHALAQAIIGGATITLPQGAVTNWETDASVPSVTWHHHQHDGGKERQRRDTSEPTPSSGCERQPCSRLSAGEHLKPVVRSTGAAPREEELHHGGGAARS